MLDIKCAAVKAPIKCPFYNQTQFLDRRYRHNWTWRKWRQLTDLDRQTDLVPSPPSDKLLIRVLHSFVTKVSRLEADPAAAAA